MWLLALLGCDSLFGITPSVDQLQVTPDRCGRWTAVIEATGDGDRLELFADGFPAGSWKVQGYGQTVTATGASGPSRTIVFEARMAGSVEQSTVVMPPLDSTVTLSPMDASFAVGSAPQLAVSLTTACPAGSAAWTARATGGWQGQGPLAPVGTPTTILLPKQPRGRQKLDVDVSVSGAPAGRAQVVFYIGDPSDDLDGDGSIGAANGPDCNDYDRTVHPGASEGTIANLVDDDCDGITDEGRPPTTTTGTASPRMPATATTPIPGSALAPARSPTAVTRTAMGRSTTGSRWSSGTTCTTPTTARPTATICARMTRSASRRSWSSSRAARATRSGSSSTARTATGTASRSARR